MVKPYLCFHSSFSTLVVSAPGAEKTVLSLIELLIIFTDKENVYIQWNTTQPFATV